MTKMEYINKAVELYQSNNYYAFKMIDENWIYREYLYGFDYTTDYLFIKKNDSIDLDTLILNINQYETLSDDYVYLNAKEITTNTNRAKEYHQSKETTPKLDISIEKDNIKRSLSCLTKNINSILDKIVKL